MKKEQQNTIIIIDKLTKIIMIPNLNKFSNQRNKYTALQKKIINIMEKEQKTLVTILPRETIPRPRPESIIVHTEALKKSIELISKFEYIIHDGDKHYSQSICNFCKNFFPTLQGKDYTCKSCGETFCVKHRQMLNHQCKKMTPAFEKYLQSKNLLRSKLKAAKNKIR